MEVTDEPSPSHSCCLGLGLTRLIGAEVGLGRWADGMWACLAIESG